MSTFWVRGVFAGKERTVEWRDGKLSGDRMICAALPLFAESLRGIPIGPPEGPTWTNDFLKVPLAAVFLMREVFEEILDGGGDLPVPPPIPEGANP